MLITAVDYSLTSYQSTFARWLVVFVYKNPSKDSNKKIDRGIDSNRE